MKMTTVLGSDQATALTVVCRGDVLLEVDQLVEAAAAALDAAHEATVGAMRLQVNLKPVLPLELREANLQGTQEEHCARSHPHIEDKGCKHDSLGLLRGVVASRLFACLGHTLTTAESSPYRALEGSVLGVRVHVLHQCFPQREGFSAELAPVRLLACETICCSR